MAISEDIRNIGKKYSKYMSDIEKAYIKELTAAIDDFVKANPDFIPESFEDSLSDVIESKREALRKYPEEVVREYEVYECMAGWACYYAENPNEFEE